MLKKLLQTLSSVTGFRLTQIDRVKEMERNIKKNLPKVTDFISAPYIQCARLNETPDKERIIDTHDTIDLSHLFLSLIHI